MKRHRERNRGHSNQLATIQEISRLAAKILAEEGINDYLLAKQRAIQRLHLPAKTGLPKNSEIHKYLAEHLEIFDRNRLTSRQAQFRKLAQEIMDMLEEFQPLAVGSIVDGIITKSSRLQIHLFASTPEHVATTLMEKNIPYQLTEQVIRYTATKTENKPAYNFLMGDTPVSLCVFSENERRKIPIDPITGKSTERISLNSMKNIL